MTSTTATSNTSTDRMTLYDIALAPPVTENACSPNPWKARFALNFKKIAFKTTWVPLLDISSVRGAFNIPASRTFADGSPYHTLPVLIDPTTGSTIGDSFEIAKYLQKQYPTSGAGDLFPPQDLGFAFGTDPDLFVPIAEAQATEGHVVPYARFNTSVDAAFSAHAQLMVEGFPFDPAVAEECKAMFSKRAGVQYDLMAISGEAREKLLKAFEETLGRLAALYKRDESGPFLLGTRASYADFIVGGWLRMSRVMLPKEEWEALKGWHGGVFGRLHEALEGFARMD